MRCARVLAFASLPVLGVLAGTSWAYVRYLSSAGAPLVWLDRSIVLGVSPDTPPGLDYDDAFARTEEAIDQWMAIDCDPPALSAVRDPSATIDPSDFRSSLVWFDSVADWNRRFSSLELARTIVIHRVQSGAIVDADIAVNIAGFPFSADASCHPSRYDLQSALTHEIGHLFGLDHSTVGSATMAARSDTGECGMRTLDPDDVAGLCAIYDRPAAIEPESIEAGPELVDHLEAVEKIDSVEADGGRDEGCAGGSPLGLIGLVSAGLVLARRAMRM